MAARRNTIGKAGGSTRQNVRVICRIRPTNKKELENGGVVCITHSDTTIEITHQEGENKFNFDRIFGPESTQLEVFEYTAGPIIDDVLQGYNATVFAYGQTGTGKTHTMEGIISDPELKGIIPRTVDALFDGVAEADESIEFTFKVSYVEIYLEKIRDLLDSNRVKTNLAVREDKIKGIYIAGVTEEYVTSEDELLDIMALGATNRATAATGMNEGSSRSHSVFTITISQKDTNTNATKSGKLVLVDLAGSEMVRKSNASGQQLEEAKTINKSLSSLGQVINALTDEKQTHVPYRDSKLTRVLQDSLGGNSKTVLIIAISPSSFNASESISTMRFGNRAKSIQNKVTINQTRSVEELEALLVRAEKAIDAQTAHIISLSTQLQALQAAQISSAASRDEDSDTDNDNDNDNESDAANAAGGQTSASESSVDTQAVAAAAAAARAEARAEAEAAAVAQLQESSNVIAKLQETIEMLTQELDEERQESERKDNELKQLANLLKDKDRLIQDAASMLSEVQRNGETLRERSEQLLREKIEAVGELESLRSIMEEEVNRSKFNLMELEVTLTTLEEENKQLKEEIAQMSGDAQEARVHKSYAASAAEAEAAAAASRAAAEEAAERATAAAAAAERSRADSRHFRASASMYADEFGIAGRITSGNRKELMDQFSEQFENTCIKHNLPPEASAELFALVDYVTVEQDKLLQAQEERAAAKEKQASKRTRDLEDHRSRLEKDLQGRVESMIQTQVKLDAIGHMDGQQLLDNVVEKERMHMRSLQQRLEQLVAVHRQLLRKFASLELENSEMKKKTHLRDERIRQLESNSRGLVSNIRQQAEKHVTELTRLREQIQILKAEHEQRVEHFARSDGHSGAGGHGAARGGGAHPVRGVHTQRTLRGGGGRSHSFFDHQQQQGGHTILGGGGGSIAGGSSSARPLPAVPMMGAATGETGAGYGSKAPPAPAATAAAQPHASLKGGSVLSRFLGNNSNNQR